MFDVEQLIRPNIKKLSPYQSARQDFSEGLLLDANENSLGAPFTNDKQLHRYPDPVQKKLRGLIARWRGVRAKNIFTGVGSDEAIDILFRIFCTPGKDRIITVPPTYGMYRVSANIHDIAIDEVLLEKDNFQPCPDEILGTVTSQTKMLFLCSPNNPTGNTFEKKRVTKLINEFPGLVVLDEAYIDFSDQRSWAEKVAEHPNLVVLQTMSKSFGLAGIRLGIAYAQQKIIDYMMKVKAPYNVNKLTSRQAIKGLQNWQTVEFNIDIIRQERANLQQNLKQLPFVRKVYDSQANFLLVKMDNVKALYQELAQQNIIVRYRGDEPLCENCLRITVGTPDENELLISTLKNITP